MNLYDLIVKKIKNIQGVGDESPVTNISTSSMLTAEITLISSILVALVERFTGIYDVLYGNSTSNSNHPVLLGEFKCLKG